MATEKVEIANEMFQDLVIHRQYMPNRNIVRKINDKTFPFNENKFFAYYPAKLASNEFNRCVEIYMERGENGHMMDTMRLMGELIEEETPHREELENLAIDLVREMYNVPDDFDLKAILKKPENEEDGDGFEDQEKANISDKRKKELKPEVEKRRILNSIVHGAAIHQWTSAYYIVADKLNDINPDLLQKYNKLSALVNFWNWSIDQQEMFGMGAAPVVQGFNKVDVEKKEIKAHAMNFPVLIHELSKGVIDFLITKGLPELPPDELQYVYDEADKYSHEQWHYCFGPTLWRALLDTSDASSHDLPPIISEMSQMKYDDLANFCIDICFHPEEIGKKEMEKLKKVSY
jgi:hypothetical protein